MYFNVLNVKGRPPSRYYFPYKFSWNFFFVSGITAISTFAFFFLHFYMGQKIGHWQPYRDEELKRQKWSYWDLWQATPFTTTKQTTLHAVNYRQTIY